MTLVGASSHYLLRLYWAVFHLQWSWTRTLLLSVSDRRVQILPEREYILVSADW